MRYRTIPAILWFLALGTGCWAQSSLDEGPNPEDPRFFSIDFPEDQDVTTAFDGLKGDYEGHDLQLEFTGRIGSQGKKIRVIWTSGDGKKTDDYTLAKYKAGDPTFVYRVSGPLSNLAFGSNRYRFVVTFQDGSVKEQILSLFVIHGHMGERAKPVIYLYPTQTAEVSVTVAPAGGVTVSIPELNAGWRVKATPQGTLTNLADGKTYPYLFWESRETTAPDRSTKGFAVSRTDLPAFFEEKLTLLGLNGQEKEDFTEFWLPLMAEWPWYRVLFHTPDQIEAAAPLGVKPQPDTVIRVYFEFEGSGTKPATQGQLLIPQARRGFTVVEWGGPRP